MSDEPGYVAKKKKQFMAHIKKCYSFIHSFADSLIHLFNGASALTLRWLLSYVRDGTAIRRGWQRSHWPFLESVSRACSETLALTSLRHYLTGFWKWSRSLVGPKHGGYSGERDHTRHSGLRAVWEEAEEKTVNSSKEVIKNSLAAGG